MVDIATSEREVLGRQLRYIPGKKGKRGEGIPAFFSTNFIKFFENVGIEKKGEIAISRITPSWICYSVINVSKIVFRMF